MKRDDTAIRNEYDLFHLLTKKGGRPDVEEAFLAIQAGLAFGARRINIGRVCGQMMAFPGRTMSSYCAPIGAEGLAYFFFLFKVELECEGGSDYHDYRFARRHDGREIVANLKTAGDPEGARFQRRYYEALGKLVKGRERMIAKHEVTKTLIIESLGQDEYRIRLPK